MNHSTPPLVIVFLAVGVLFTASCGGYSCYEPIDTFLSLFWSTSDAYINKYSPNTGQLSEYWNYAECLDTVIDGVVLARAGLCDGTGPELPFDYEEYVDIMYTTQAAKGWFRDYYDDMNWMGMALMRAYILLGDNKYLTTAQSLYSKIEAQWDTTCCGSHKGGIWWDSAHSQKASASNAGPVIFAMMLYNISGDSNTLNFAKQVYQFWWDNMVNQETGQVADHFDKSGSITWWKFTYNEGLMIGASVSLYNATGDSTYLSNAHKIATFMISNEVISSSCGNVLYDGSSCSDTDCAQFKGPGYSDILDACSCSLTVNARQSSTGAYGHSWEGPAPSDGDTINNAEESAAVMALAINARNKNRL
ncbi:carbohydrate-binding protein [Pelomyxa schiedti]|nr:carbohydrate-binding protein [Pelomyxa schiedti]